MNSIYKQLLKTHVFIAVVGALSVMAIIILLLQLQQLSRQAIEDSGPLAVYSVEATEGVQHSLASLRAWISSGSESERVQRLSAWENKIEPAIKRMKELLADDRYASRLVDIEKRLQKLKKEQWWTEDIAHTPGNTPILLLAIDIDSTANTLFQHASALQQLAQRYDDVHVSIGTTEFIKHMFSIQNAVSINALRKDIFDVTLIREDMLMAQRIAQSMRDEQPEYGNAMDIIQNGLLHDFAVLEQNILALDAVNAKGAEYNIASDKLSSVLIPLAQSCVRDLSDLSTVFIERMESDGLQVMRYGDYAFDLSVGLIIFLIIYALYVSHRSSSAFVKPIVALTEATKDRTVTSDIQELQIVKNDEIGILTQSFNDMQRAIQASYRRIKEQNIELKEAMRTSELERLRAEEHARLLKQANDDLEHFAYIASHDLRSPLRNICTLVQWLEEDISELISADSVKTLDLIRARAMRLDRLLEDLLAYSQAGRKSEVARDVDVQEMLEGLVDLYRNHQRVIEVHFDTPMPSLYTEAAALELVFRNLINNAVKHHDRETVVFHFACRQDQGSWSFTVRDDGPGIAPQYHDQVFVMFKTLKSRNEVEGSGMGLAMIRRVVELRGGGVTLVSESGKRGCAFTFDWPCVLSKEVSNVS